MSCIPHAGDTFTGRRKSFQDVIFNPEAEIIQERKWLDTPADVKPNISKCNRTSVNVTCLNLIAQGTSQNERVGKIIRIRNIGLRGTIEADHSGLNGVADPGGNLIMLVWDKQPNRALATGDDILQYGEGLIAPDAPSSTFLNMYNADRFVVLRRYYEVLGPWEKDAGFQGYAGSPTVDKIDWNLSVDLETVYRNANGVIGSIHTGALLLVTTGDVNPFLGDDKDYKFSYHARIRWVDA